MNVKELTIGTSNNNRFNNLKDIILEINPLINIIQASLDVIESSNTTAGNATLKAQAYFDSLKTNILCADDGIFLEDKEYSPEVMVKRDKDGKELSREEIIQKWKLILRDMELKGKMEKTFVLINVEGKKFVSSIRYKIVLRDSEDINFQTNPLNNFIYPEGFNKSITHFTSEELLRFREPQKECLSELIKKIK